MKKGIVSLVCLTAFAVLADINVIPRPNKIVEKSGFKVGQAVQHVLPQSGAKRTLLFFEGK